FAHRTPAQLLDRRAEQRIHRRTGDAARRDREQQRRERAGVRRQIRRDHEAVREQRPGERDEPDPQRACDLGERPRQGDAPGKARLEAAKREDRARRAARQGADLGRPRVGVRRREGAGERRGFRDVRTLRPCDRGERRDPAVGGDLPRGARAALRDGVEGGPPGAAGAREGGRRGEEREQHDREADPAAAVDQRADDERRERAVPRQRTRAPRRLRARGGEGRAGGVGLRVQDDDAAASASSSPSTVNSAATASTRIPAARAALAVTGPIAATVFVRSSRPGSGTLRANPSTALALANVTTSARAAFSRSDGSRTGVVAYAATTSTTRPCARSVSGIVSRPSCARYSSTRALLCVRASSSAASASAVLGPIAATRASPKGDALRSSGSRARAAVKSASTPLRLVKTTQSYV